MCSEGDKHSTALAGKSREQVWLTGLSKAGRDTHPGNGWKDAVRRRKPAGAGTMETPHALGIHAHLCGCGHDHTACVTSVRQNSPRCWGQPVLCHEVAPNHMWPPNP